MGLSVIFSLSFSPSPSLSLSPFRSFDYKTKTILMMNRLVKLQLWNTVNCENIRHNPGITLTKHYRNIDGVLLCYDIFDRSSLTLLRSWCDALNSTHQGLFGLVIALDYSNLSGSRVISHAEGVDFANYYNLFYYELSPFTSSHDEISSPFDHLASLCTRRMLPSSSSFTNCILRDPAKGTGWTIETHKLFHPSFRSFVKMILFQCRGFGESQRINKEKVQKEAKVLSVVSLPKEIWFIIFSYCHRGLWQPQISPSTSSILSLHTSFTAE